MPAPTITALPTAPSTADPTNFATEADAFIAALDTFASEANALAAYYAATGLSNAATLGGKTWAAPDPIGSGTPNTGAFTDLSATGNVTLGNAYTDTVTINSTLAKLTRTAGQAAYFRSTDGTYIVDCGIAGDNSCVVGTNSAHDFSVTSGGSNLYGKVAGSTITTTTGGGISVAGAVSSSGDYSFTTNTDAYIDARSGSGSSLNLRGYDHVGIWTGSSITERIRVSSVGDVTVGKTSTSVSLVGTVMGAFGDVYITRDNAQPLYLNRLTGDGNLLSFNQDGTEEGSISVSGTTVSYNAFLGSHWSQLSDGSKPEILRGTVMESLDEMCVWPGENNDRLPKSKVSDTAASKKVYGVFLDWDTDWCGTNDLYIASVGAGYIRMQAGQAVQRGDFVESAGDGTARVQSDDVVRSSTIGKVTSATVQETYGDGSFVVPCVLYAG